MMRAPREDSIPQSSIRWPQGARPAHTGRLCRSLRSVLRPLAEICFSLGPHDDSALQRGSGSPVLASAGTSITSFFVRIPSANFKILCEGVDSKTTIGAKWKSKLTIEFTKCTVYNLEGVEEPRCKVVKPVVFELLDQLIYKAGKKEKKSTTSSTGQPAKPSWVNLTPSNSKGSRAPLRVEPSR
ncbi:MAG TPA: hypothetical protein VGL57_01810 [Solirubrobacteraceae bacterium]